MFLANVRPGVIANVFGGKLVVLPDSQLSAGAIATPRTRGEKLAEDGCFVASGACGAQMESGVLRKPGEEWSHIQGSELASCGIRILWRHAA
jgi:hypothetical protein